jgi:hypothetical protein
VVKWALAASKPISLVTQQAGGDPPPACYFQSNLSIAILTKGNRYVV